MKCPSCKNDQKRREGMTCTKCAYVHALDPKADGISDLKFAGLLKSASRNDTYYFTENQLYAVYCRGRTKLIPDLFDRTYTPLGAFGLVMLFAGLAAGVFGSCGKNAASIGAGIVLAALGFGVSRVGSTRRLVAAEHREPPEMAKLREWISKWEAARGPIQKLLRTPTLEPGPAPYREVDIHDYGAERVIVVQHDLHVDLLVRNNFHAEQRALIVSERGYPSYVVSQIEALLEKRPSLPIILLHDATREGVGMRERVYHSPALPFRGRHLVDAGLFPRQVPKLKVLDATAPETVGNAVPVDFLPFAVIAGGLGTAATAHGLAVARVPNRPEVSVTTSGGGSSSGSVDTLVDVSSDDASGATADGHTGDASSEGGSDFGGDGADGGDGGGDFG